MLYNKEEISLMSNAIQQNMRKKVLVEPFQHIVQDFLPLIIFKENMSSTSARDSVIFWTSPNAAEPLLMVWISTLASHNWGNCVAITWLMRKIFRRAGHTNRTCLTAFFVGGR